MKTSIEWLNEYAKIDVSAKELADILTMTGSKVETIETKGEDIKNVVIGKILEIEKHPDADKLIVTKVDVGEEIIQIITGADNVNVGDIIPVAKDGASLPGGVKIKTGKLRGVESCGMMCSIGELGISKEEFPNQIEHGIMILPKEYEQNLGQDVVEILDLKETVIDFEITPNRPDCLGVEGLGRETAVSLGQSFVNPRANIDKLIVEDKNEIDGLKVDVEATDLCYRYVARVVKDVKIGPSPKWMVKRLKACGMRSINNIVDVTNYVMLEMGEPMHAFDIESVEGKHIIVRRAKKGEKIITLDDVQRNLDEEMLVISDEKKAVAVAGVMGGQNSEIEQTTKTIVLEAAVFDRGSVRKTSKKLGLRTESSSRFEKGLSTENALRAINRAVELIEQLGAGKAVDGKIDRYSKKQEQVKIEFDENRINNLLGINISKEEMKKTLEKLDIKVEGNIAIPPYFRMDIEQEADLAEEVLRFYGYDKLGSTLPNTSETIGTRTKIQKIEKKVRDLLTNSGFSEIYTYGFLSEKQLEKVGEQDLIEASIKIINPLSEDYTIMRQSTIPSMLGVLETNNNYKNQEVKLYDISRTYKDTKGEIEKGNIPEEERVITIGMYGKQVDFYVLKGIVENVLNISGLERYEIRKENQNKSYHPGRCAKICVGIDDVVTLGQIHPQIAKNYGINQEVYLAQISLTKLEKYARVNKKYTPIPKFPAVERDIAVVVPDEVQVGDIEKVMLKQAKKMLEKVDLFDIYKDDKIGKNKKSVAYALIFRDEKKTLTDEDVNPIMKKIIKELQSSFSAELRM